MRHTQHHTIFLLFLSSMLFSCTSHEPVSLATAVSTQLPTPAPAQTATATAIPPTATSTAVPPTATLGPDPTATEPPTSTATAIPPTPQPAETIAPPPTAQANLGPTLEWVLPKETPAALVSFSGGSMTGFVVYGELAYTFLGNSLAVIDMGQVPYGQELYRISLPGDSWSFVRSGRFLFTYLSNRTISVIDLSDPQNVAEVARIKGLGEGLLYQGDKGEVYFFTHENRWWQLDVDQVLPAESVPEKPKLARAKYDDGDFYDEVFLPYSDSILEQLEPLNPAATHWFPSQVQQMGDDYIYWTPTRGESGGGQLVRLDVSDPDNVVVKAIYRSFMMNNIDYEDNFLYTSFAYEIAGGGAMVDVSDPALPRLDRLLSYSANAHVVVGNYLLAGNFPGLNVYDLANDLAPLAEVSLADEQASYPFLAQIVTNPERTLMFGLTGIYGDRGGIAVYLIEDPAEPMLLSYIFAAQPTGIKYAADRLYIYGSNQTGTVSTLKVYGVSDPANPQELTAWSTEERLIGLEAWQDGSGRHLIAALTPDELSIWDVSDPAADFKLLGKLFAPPACVVEPGNSTPRRTTIAGDWLFAPLGKCPTNRIDVSDPANPVILDTLDSNGPMIFEDGLLFMGGRNLRIYRFDS